jgi:deoxyadenosine/deoxycytidine kinase
MELLKDSITELELTMYNQWCDMWSYILPMRVDKWVLLNTSLDESLKRISFRDRNGEKSGVSIEYQTNLYEKHIEFYKKLTSDGKPVVVIESNIMDENIIDDNDKIDNIIGKILDININNINNFKCNKDENEKAGILSWLLDLI